MKALLPVLGLLAALSASGCDGKDSAAEAPPPVALTAEAIGHYCGMALLEHEGPKGQILLRGSDRPVWFSSARDTIAFTMLAEEAKTLRAIYVSDMGRAESWDQPGATNGGGAPRAGRDRQQPRRRHGRGGGGALLRPPAAERFAAEHCGRVLAFTQIPRTGCSATTAPAQRRPSPRRRGTRIEAVTP